ncbi:MAG: hypothetical protein MR908_00120 [Firmicutes bacterium]|nr:hypothetical protein [Bacillota bacterium]
MKKTGKYTLNFVKIVEKSDKKGYNKLLKLTENIHWVIYDPNEDINEI